MEAMPNNPEELRMERRACMNCRIIQTFGEFYIYGCPNCERFMRFRLNIERVVHCTTMDYQGVFCSSEPLTRWWARIIPLVYFVPGKYAFLILGSMASRFLVEFLSEDVLSSIGGNGI